MHESGAQTRPQHGPEVMEWGFIDGGLALVANLPSLSGSWQVSDLLDADLSDPMQRKIARALLELAVEQLDATEPASTNGVAR